jgi:NADH-ubiquinone oxidoreductase chain 5
MGPTALLPLRRKFTDFYFLLFVSTGLTVCYSFRLFYFVLCGDFNFVSLYSMVDTNYNIVMGMIGLLVLSVLGGGALI